jgi:3-dehydroquinate dehydratase II
MRVLVIHGPNLNLLGDREPEIYGTQSLDDVNELIETSASDLGLSVRCAQYNGEGQIVDALHAARDGADLVVINPGAYAHYSYAIADAIKSIGIPTIEVHLSNIHARDEFRRTSVTAAACRGTVGGFGPLSYVLALHAAAKMLGK